jgi:dipeptidyl aminopeptidase/acylaminoacyl peptidase
MSRFDSDLDSTRRRLRMLVFAGVAAAGAVLLTVAESVTAAAPSASALSGQLLVVAAAPHASKFGPAEIEIAHVYDAGGRLLDTATAPDLDSGLTWSPDGTQLAVANADGLWVERPDGSGRRQLLAHQRCKKAGCVVVIPPTVAWTPDGTHLAVGTVNPNSHGFELVDVASGQARPLRPPKPSLHYYPIAFSPDGRLLAYTLTSGEPGYRHCCATSLVVAQADGTKPRVLYRFKDPLHDSPAGATWSPDSTRIAFTDDGGDGALKDPRFVIVDVGSGEPHIINPRQIADQSPAWSPDGTHLALWQYKAPAFTIAADGTDFHPLGSNIFVWQWQQDGDLLVTDASDHTIAELLTDGGPARALFTLPDHETVRSIREQR